MEGLQVIEQNQDVAIIEECERSKGMSLISKGNLQAVRNILYTVPGLRDFAARIQTGQTLVLDISKETMRKIQSGELKLMKTHDDVLKAVICEPGGSIKQHLNVKYEQFCNVPNPAELANTMQMANMVRQLANISEQLELVGYAVQDVLVGQHNDRIALYYAGEQLYLEAQKTKNEFLRLQLVASALRSLEEGRTKMIESIKADIMKIEAHDAKLIKLKPEEIAERVNHINAGFDVINRSAQLKASIYYELGETEAMLLSLQNYAGFLEENINCNQQLLYDYDKSDTKLDGKWHERARALPQSIYTMIEDSKQDQQRLEIDYTTLQKVGLLGE